MIATVAAAAVAAFSTGPSFDCARAHTQVERMICRDPKAAALDRQLSETYTALSGQGGTDAKALRQEEDRWLATVRDACTTAGCLRRVYGPRIDDLRLRSRHEASPAAFDETQPFAAPPAAWAAARATIGKACGWKEGEIGAHIAGFAPVTAAWPVALNDHSVVARQLGGARFAFLVRFSDKKGEPKCLVDDVVALPPASAAPAFLQCTAVLDDKGPPGGDNWINGFGVRKPGQRQPVGFWTLRPDGRHLERVAMGVLGLQGKVRCQEPETGD